VKNVSAATQLTAFIARFDPGIAKLATAARAKLRRQLRGAVEMVYDNYNALVIGFSPTERPSDAVVSLALYPKRVNLFFLQGKHLDDPSHLLQGDGNQVRFIRLDDRAAVLETPAIRALIGDAIAFGDVPFRGRGRVVVRAVAAKQRPRR
jgi:hypothetical protein